MVEAPPHEVRPFLSHIINVSFKFKTWASPNSHSSPIHARFPLRNLRSPFHLTFRNFHLIGVMGPFSSTYSLLHHSHQNLECGLHTPSTPTSRPSRHTHDSFRFASPLPRKLENFFIGCVGPLLSFFFPSSTLFPSHLGNSRLVFL